MKRTYELVEKRFAEVGQEVTSVTIWVITTKLFSLKPLMTKTTREEMIKTLVPDRRKDGKT